MFWSLYSFAPESWTRLFDGSFPDAKKYFITAGWDSADPLVPDSEKDFEKYLDFLWRTGPKERVAVAEHMARNGPVYRWLSAAQSAILDSMVSGLFGSAEMEAIFKYTTDHKMGLDRRAVETLLNRSQPARVGGFLGFGGRVSTGHPVNLAPWLATGRRCRANVAPSQEDMYFVFDRSEVPELKREVESLLAVDRAWSTSEFELNVRGELLECLDSAATLGRCVAGRFS